MQQPELKTLQAVVRGRVQGVGYRFFVRGCAVRLGLSGFVRNQEDGSVYVAATGPRPALEQLLSLLQQGPAMAHVEGVEQHWSPASESGQGFEVRG